jgi:hypothetical protein
MARGRSSRSWITLDARLIRIASQSSQDGRWTRLSLDLIEAMYAIAEAGQPMTGRGVGYKLFSQGLIPSMSRSDMSKVYRLLKEAREDGAGNEYSRRRQFAARPHGSR